MKRQNKITSLTKLDKKIKKQLKFFVRQIKSEYKQDGGEDFLLRVAVKIVWFLLLFKASILVLSYFQNDNFFNTSWFLLIRFIIDMAPPSWLSRFVRGEFINDFGGIMLQFLLIALTFSYTVLFIWPGVLVQSFNKVIKHYEEK